MRSDYQNSSPAGEEDRIKKIHVKGEKHDCAKTL